MHPACGAPPANRSLPFRHALDLEVWYADLGCVPESLTGVLSSDERDRAARIIRGARRELWMRSRALLRELLGRRLGRSPATLRFAQAPGARPVLLDPAACTPQISFGVSHSGSAALYAFSTHDQVAVDLEVPRRRPRKTLKLAVRVFGADVAARLGELEGAAREQEFLRLWVRREAELKCRGVGLWGAAEGPHAWLGDGDRGASAEVWVSDLPRVSAGAYAAIATTTRPGSLDCWEQAPLGAQKILTTSFCG